MLKVSFEYSRAYQMYLKTDQPLPHQDNILNKIRIFNNFVKDNTHDEHYYQIMIIVVLALDNIL